MAVVQNQWYRFGVGPPPVLVYFSGDWDVHRGYGILTHGQIDSLPSLASSPVAGPTSVFWRVAQRVRKRGSGDGEREVKRGREEKGREGGRKEGRETGNTCWVPIQLFEHVFCRLRPPRSLTFTPNTVVFFPQGIGLTEVPCEATPGFALELAVLNLLESS